MNRDNAPILREYPGAVSRDAPISAWYDFGGTCVPYLRRETAWRAIDRATGLAPRDEGYPFNRGVAVFVGLGAGQGRPTAPAPASGAGVNGIGLSSRAFSRGL
jgi:hypothetical protein